MAVSNAVAALLLECRVAGVAVERFGARLRVRSTTGLAEPLRSRLEAKRGELLAALPDRQVTARASRTTWLEAGDGRRPLAYEFYDGQVLRSDRDRPLGFDTETALIDDERHVPDLALAVASDGETNLVIHPDDLGAFLVAHRDAFFCGHNVAAFDFWVVDRHLAGRGEAESRRVLWDACDQGRLFDTQILDMLVQLATGQFRKVGNVSAGDDQRVYPGNLAEVAADYAALRLDKDDPYRLRYGELIALDPVAWRAAASGFFGYAVRDAVAVHWVYPALAARAKAIMTGLGFASGAGHYDIRPDAVEKFGCLSEVIQVQAAVVLADMYRRGVRIDSVAASTLATKYRGELDAAVAVLERDYPEVLTRSRDGSLRRTAKRGTPSLATKKLTQRLADVGHEIAAAGHLIEVPMTSSTTPTVSRSVKAWSAYAPLHPFLEAWSRVERAAKLLGFFGDLRAERLHCRYGLLTRTGRTSCGRPADSSIPGINIQQVPRNVDFRSLFLPEKGDRLFTGDFKGAELCTLAAVCRARFGYSRLGDVIAAGTDPHVATAAAVQGFTHEEFLDLEASDPARFKDGRQAAKALNFGIPGGLGAASLVKTAAATYRVTMTEEEAGRFRETLIREVYPELNAADGYLADPSMAALARNLGLDESVVWNTLDRSGKRNPLAARGAVKVVRGLSTASAAYQGHVWGSLRRLVVASRFASPELVAAVANRKGGELLYRRLFRHDAMTLTGRVRAGVSYTEGKNTPFQSLCADGAKRALWKLLYDGFRVYAFVHDEVLVSLPAEHADVQAKEVARIMVESMEEIMGHGIPAACDYVVAGCWAKP